jgi:RNA polymerase sigma factor FliA
MNLERLRQSPGDEGRSILERLPDRKENLPSNLLERSELRKLLEELVGRIPQIERMVLRMYYQEGKTLRQIAQVARVHESRISQLKTQAILRLRSRIQKQWPGARGA